MRAFVTGTGRCGTKTFARACSHLTSHTSGHETHRGRTAGYLDYPDDHVEVDPHLSWMLALLVEKYPDALYVHLWRPEDEVVASWKRRGILPHRGAAPLVDVIFQVQSKRLSPAGYDAALRTLYRSVTASCEWIVAGVGGMSVNIYEAPAKWAEFCDRIGATGEAGAGALELTRRAV